MIVNNDEETNDNVNKRIYELAKQSPIKKGNGKWGWVSGMVLSEFDVELSCKAVRERFNWYSKNVGSLEKKNIVGESSVLITSIIVEKKNSGEFETWEQLAEYMNQKYSLELTGNAVRKRYYRATGGEENRAEIKIKNDMINDIIVMRRNAKTFSTWVELAEEINKEFNLNLTGDAVLNRYNRSIGREEINGRAVAHVVAEKPTQAKFQGYDELVELTTQNTLIIGDTHMPFTHPKYLDFVLQLRDKYRCDQVVHIGDVLDNCAISSFVSDPDGFSSGHELDATISMVGKWYDAFPDLKVCIGNHDDRHMKAAMKAGLSIKYLKTFNEILGTDSWTWAWSYLQKTNLGETLYLHGSRTGVNATRATMNDEGCSIVMGHTHSYPELLWLTNSRQTRFGLNVGCGIDKTSYAFAYGRNFANKVKLGAGVITEEGTRPMFEVFDTRLIN